MLFRVFFGLLLLPLIAGCQNSVLKKGDLAGGEIVPETQTLPFAEPGSAPLELDSDIVYSYLVGEIGAHRGELELSYNHYLHAAVLAKDAYAAERATRIAMHLRDGANALRAVRRWVDLAPNAAAARQTAALLLLREGQSDRALEQLRALVRIADSRDQDGYLQAARIFVRETDKAAALLLMRRLADDQPANASGHYALALLQVAAEDLAGAESSLRTALELKPDWPQPVVLLARVLSSQQRQAEALDLLKDAIRRQPNEAMLRTSYARMLVDLKRYEEALAEFKSLHQQVPDNDDVLYALAMLAVQTEQWDEARQAWQKLRGNRDRATEATYFLAQIEEVSGNKQLAMGLYASVKDGKLRTDAARRLAQLKVEAGQLNDAREVLQRARVLDPDSSVEIYLTEAQLLQSEGMSDLALHTYEVALTAHPENVDLLYNRGLYAAELDRIDWLERDLKRVLEIEPDNADALNALGYTLADLTDRHEEAFAYVSRAYKLKPDSAAILDSMGWVYYRLGDYDKALDYLRQALTTMNDSEIAAHLGEVLWVAGERDQAQRVWQDALRDDPDSEQIKSVMDRLK